MRLPPLTAALGLALVAALTGCASNQGGDPDPIPSPAQDAAPDTFLDRTEVDASVLDATRDATDAASDSTESATLPDASDDPPVDLPTDSKLDSTQEAAPDAPDTFEMPERLVCPTTYQDHSSTTIIGGPELTEVSGIVASVRNPDTLWLHDDSGDTARLFAVATSGQVLGRVLLDGITAVDWEDIAAGPCPDHAGPCLWIADTGNNTVVRDVLTINVIPEPEVSGPFNDLTVTTPWQLHFRYPVDPIDCEAVAVAPDGSAIYFFEKVDAAQARVFRYPAPFDPAASPTLDLVATIPSPGVPVPKGRMITAADLHASGTRLLLRVYTGIFEYHLDGNLGMDGIDQVSAQQVVIGPFDEPQGEAVGYDATGSGMWSISEAASLGFVQPLHHYDCSAPGITP